MNTYFHRSRVLLCRNNKKKNRSYKKHSFLNVNEVQKILITMMGQGYKTLFHTYQSRALLSTKLNATAGQAHEASPADGLKFRQNILSINKHRFTTVPYLRYRLLYPLNLSLLACHGGINMEMKRDQLGLSNQYELREQAGKTPKCKKQVT